MEMKIGAQLYTVRDYTQNEKDFQCTIEKIAKMGYRTVQLSAIGKDLKPERIRRICDDAGLEIVLTHSDLNRILHDTQKLIEEHDILGCSYIGIGAMPENYRTPEGLSQFATDFKTPAKMIADAGKLLMYHNHNFEFRKFAACGVPNAEPDKYMLEYILEWFDASELGITLDTYWVQAAGGDVCQWIRRWKDRVHCVHLKDMEMLEDGPAMAPVMEGNMNFTGILRELEESCCRYLLVEQDVCRKDPFDCLRISYDHLAKAGYR